MPMEQVWCEALPSGPQHVATHPRLKLCEQHFQEHQRAVLAYRKAKQRHKTKKGPNPGKRDAYINERFTPLRARYLVFPQEELESLRWRLSDLSAAAIELSAIDSEQVVYDTPTTELLATIGKMLAASTRLADELRPLLVEPAT